MASFYKRNTFSGYSRGSHEGANNSSVVKIEPVVVGGSVNGEITIN